jgi:hypothetical protein
MLLKSDGTGQPFARAIATMDTIARGEWTDTLVNVEKSDASANPPAPPQSQVRRLVSMIVQNHREAFEKLAGE